MIDWTKISNNEEVIKLIKQREKLENKIRAIDNMALVRYELERLAIPFPSIKESDEEKNVEIQSSNTGTRGVD